MFVTRLLSLLLLSFSRAEFYNFPQQNRTFRAAVYEHAVHLGSLSPQPVTREKALEHMMLNLAVYKSQADLAGSENVDILVFPEMGIYGMAFTRQTMAPYLENIIDPEKEVWNACEQPDRHPNTEVQHFLSCLAKNNSLYVVANFGDRQICDVTSEHSCPRDGQYQFNTNIVYDRNGILIAKYHKINLYFEKQFDFTPINKGVTFTTPFGVFALGVCFDILFHDPLIDLITKQGIRNIVFPTAWRDSLPFLSSIEYHSAFAAGLGLNLLAANINFPSKRFHGSGIYTPEGAKLFYYNSKVASGKLLISDIPILERRLSNMTYTTSPALTTPVSQTLDFDFQSLIHYDMYNLKLLNETTGTITVCHNSICCQLSYSKENTTEVYAFGAFDGLHGAPGYYYMYLQVCTLLRCAGNGTNRCAVRTTHAQTMFHNVHIVGYNFTSFIYPEVLLTRNGSLSLSIGQWKYSNGILESPDGFEAPLVSTSLYGRYYSKNDTNGRESWYPIHKPNRNTVELQPSHAKTKYEYLNTLLLFACVMFNDYLKNILL